MDFLLEIAAGIGSWGCSSAWEHPGLSRNFGISGIAARVKRGAGILWGFSKIKKKKPTLGCDPGGKGLGRSRAGVAVDVWENSI